MVSAAPSDTPPLWRRYALIVCMFLSTASTGFLQPFVPLYLEASGLRRDQIGLVTGAGAGLALAIQPLLGALSDRLDSRRPLMLISALVAGIAYTAHRDAGGLWSFLLLSAIGTNGTSYLGAASGVLVGRMVPDPSRGASAYAGYRVWGSVGYIIVALVTGWMVSRSAGLHVRLDREALRPIFVYGPLLFVAIAVSALFVPDRKNVGLMRLPSRGSGRREGVSVNLRAFLIAYFLYQFSLYGATAYISLYLKSLGASSLWITGTFAAGVVCEVLVMTRVGRFSDRFGRRPALAVAFLLMPIRLLLYIPATGPLWVMMVQILHGFNYGIIGAIAIVFVNDLAPDRARGAAQARLAATSGLALAIGPAACGWLSQHTGIQSMFAVMSLVGAVGAAVFLTSVRESHPTPVSLSDRAVGPLKPLTRLLSDPWPQRARGRKIGENE